MLANRFDNLSIENLVVREEEARDEHNAVIAALQRRLITACPVDTGKVYCFREGLVDLHGKPSWLRGKQILVGCVTVSKPRWEGDSWCLNIQGFLSNARSSTGDGFNRKMFLLRGWDMLDLSSATLGPRSYGAM